MPCGTRMRTFNHSGQLEKFVTVERLYRGPLSTGETSLLPSESHEWHINPDMAAASEFTVERYETQIRRSRGEYSESRGSQRWSHI